MFVGWRDIEFAALIVSILMWPVLTKDTSGHDCVYVTAYVTAARYCVSQRDDACLTYSALCMLQPNALHALLVQRFASV